MFLQTRLCFVFSWATQQPQSPSPPGHTEGGTANTSWSQHKLQEFCLWICPPEIHNPEPSSIQEFRLQSKQKTLLCCFNSPLQLKMQTLGHLAVGVQDVVGIEGEQEVPHDISSVGRWSQLQSQTLPMWAANPCPGRLWKMMGCSREEPDLLLHKILSLNCHYAWNF